MSEESFPITGMSPEAIEELRPQLHRVVDAMLDRAKHPSATLQMSQRIDTVPTPRPSKPHMNVFLNVGSTLTLTVKDPVPLRTAEEIDELLSEGETYAQKEKS